MKLRNDKEINALFASAHILPQNPQKFLAAQDILPRIARIRTD